MNHGPLIFLGAFLTMAFSWFGMIVMPQIQFGRQEQAIVQPTNERYPTEKPGLAEQGRAVYVANGCQYCHTRSIQAGITFNVVLSDTGTNQNKTRLIDAVQKAIAGSTNGPSAASIVETAPQYVKRHLTKPQADLLAEQLKVDEAKVEVALEYTGLDIQRHWGNRFSVAQDYLYDQPALVGQLRLGPDLSNVGARYRFLPWHLIHLYDPDSGSPSSKMPALRFLFETRPIASSTFSASDLVNLPSLGTKLKQPSRAFDTWLAAQLSSATKQALANYQGQGSNEAPFQNAIVQDLNQILHGNSIYEKQRFAEVTLRSETQTLISDSPQRSNPQLLNRLLIEDAYPLEVSRKLENPSPNALRLPVSQIGAGIEVIPKPEAIALSYYLMSLTAYPGLAEAPAATEPPRPRQLTAALATNQAAAVALMEQQLTNQTAAVTAARQALLNASFTAPQNDVDLRTKIEDLRTAELALALARADHASKIQISADRLTSVQISALAAQSLRGGGAPRGGGGGGGRGRGGGAPPDGGTAAPPAAGRGG